jgi:nucleotide-binding universal stress UspA family protein/hemerythrin-like domain-containing protein
MYRHLIVPTDGTALSVETIGQAVAFAKSIDARITFLHAHRDYAADPDGALFYSTAPSMFADLSAGESRAILARAVAAARAAQVPCDAVIRTSNRPYEAILAAAHERGCDAVFMASHGHRGLKGRFVGSQTLKVLTESTIPVIVAANEANSPISAETRAINILQDEHRSLAAVLHALAHVLQSTGQGVAPDFRLVRAMLHYIDAFSTKLHHPKEDDYIFSRLRRRTAEASDLVAVLQQQHAQDHEMTVNLAHQLAAYERDPHGGLAAFRDSLQRFTEFTWQHMTLEEKLILSVAHEHFTEQDWEEIAHAFTENGDPRFGDEVDADYRSLFSKLLNLVPMDGSEGG